MAFIPWSAYVLTGFGIVYGWILSRAAAEGVYRITGVRFLDAYVLAWLIGLAAGYTPLCLYLAFGFKEFAEPADGHYTRLIHWAGRAEVLFGVAYALFILITVPQRSDHPVTAQDVGQVIVLNVAFALSAILFAAIKGLLGRVCKLGR